MHQSVSWKNALVRIGYYSSNHDLICRIGSSIPKKSSYHQTNRFPTSNNNRFKSTIPMEEIPSVSKCPHDQQLKQQKQQKSPETMTIERDGSNNVIYDNDPFVINKPILQHVPSLPFVGTCLPWYSKIPINDTTNDRAWNIMMREKFGDFYTFGIPGSGTGLHGTIYSITDAREYAKVIRVEGKYPSGGIERLWPMKRFHKERNNPIARGELDGLFGRGHDWRVFRTFLQTDLLSPAAATGYIKPVIAASEVASQYAPYYPANNTNHYLNRCTFDLFTSVLFGELLKCTTPETKEDLDDNQKENVKFVKHTVGMLELTMALMFSPKETLINQFLPFFKTKKYREFEQEFESTLKIADKKIELFKNKYKLDELNDMQKCSYLANAMKRQSEQDLPTDHPDYITDEKLLDISRMLLFASVDTTTGILSWAVLHLAMHPHMQDIIYREMIQNNVAVAVSEEEASDNTETQVKWRLSSEALAKRSSLEYLYAFLRECHRVTPAVPASTIRTIASDVEIHGVTLPAGSTLQFTNYPIPMDANYIDDPYTFNPSNFLPDAVEARKNTFRELVDHPYYKEPFSLGPRKCPASRVAMNEVVIFLCQLILDHHIRVVPENSVKSYQEVPYRFAGSLTPQLPSIEFIPRKMA